MAKNVCLLVFMSLAVLARAENESTWLFSSLNKAPASPPAPTDPCAVIVYNMMDCMDFLTLDQPTNNKPSASCCTGFESVLAVSPLCVCEAVKTAGDIGLELNMTRSAKLPALCGATSFDNNLCEANAAPPHGSSTTPPRHGSSTTPPLPVPEKKAPAANAPAAATAAETVSGSYYLNTVSAIFVGVVGIMVSFYLA